MTPEFWRGKRVFVTGHTGFKGSWLCLWLQQMGAVVYGYALTPPTEPNHFSLIGLDQLIAKHQIADIRDLPTLTAALQQFQPEIVFHLAAQPILRLSYAEPVETYSTNVMGTVNLLEAVRHTPSVRVTLNITSDKCYENTETPQPYVETSRMGGHDPYSSSKGCAELVAAAYGRSFFNQGKMVLASVRAGNVIGGGDWAKDRLMTDIIAAVSHGKRPVIRRPHSVRPWQHVLEPLSGYIIAAEHLSQTMPNTPQAWNFGPDTGSEAPVEQVANQVCKLWGFAAGIEIIPDPQSLHEATLLKLDSSKAKRELNWHPCWSLSEALTMTVDWFKALQAGKAMREISLQQIASYEKAGR